MADQYVSISAMQKARADRSCASSSSSWIHFWARSRPLSKRSRPAVVTCEVCTSVGDWGTTGRDVICVVEEGKSRENRRENREMPGLDCSSRRRPLRDHRAEDAFEIDHGRLFTPIGSTSCRPRSPIRGLSALFIKRSTEWPRRSLKSCSSLLMRE